MTQRTVARLVGWLLIGLGLALAAAGGAGAATDGDPRKLTFEPGRAIAYSQKAIGRQPGDHTFYDTRNRAVSLSEFRGAPLVVNLVYTACTQSCPVIVQTLRRAVTTAQDSLGADNFAVVTVGFDPRYDTPERLRAFARAQGVGDVPNWRFLSADRATIDALLKDLGFIAIEAPQGFDHIAQTTILDSKSRVRAHVYGATFRPPALVEPLKGVLSDEAELASFDGLVERIRLFCTLYDPSTGRYAFDYAFFIAMAVGALALTAMATVLVRAALRRPRETES